MDQNRKKTLKRYKVSSDVFDDLLKTYNTYICKTDNIKDYFGGYKNKIIMMYDGREYIICREYLINNDDINSNWKQVIVRRDEKLPPNSIEKDENGTLVWMYMIRMLLKYYTRDEIDECLSKYKAPYNYKKIQLHYNYSDMDGLITKHNNCFKYDINSAYGYYLKQIFPKATEDIDKLYRLRKEHPEYKSYFNYFIGMLNSPSKKKKYGETYNWIVQQTRQKLEEAIRYTGGVLIYANTDGYVVRNPNKNLKVDKEIGNFKLEYQGVAYTYTDKNYSCIYTNELTGNVLYQVRDKIDLSKGQVVHYDRIKNGNIYEAKNIEVEEVGYDEY